MTINYDKQTIHVIILLVFRDMEVQLYLTNVFSVIFFSVVTLLYAGMIKIINIFLIKSHYR